MVVSVDLKPTAMNNDNRLFAFKELSSQTGNFLRFSCSQSTVGCTVRLPFVSDERAWSMAGIAAVNFMSINYNGLPDIGAIQHSLRGGDHRPADGDADRW